MLLYEGMSFFLLFLPVEPTLVGEAEKNYLLEEIPNPTALFQIPVHLHLGSQVCIAIEP